MGRLRINPVGVPYAKTGSGTDGLHATIGARIRELRLEHNLTQTGLGNATGINHATLSFYENGRRAQPLDALIALAHYFEVPLSALVSEEDL